MTNRSLTLYKIKRKMATFTRFAKGREQLNLVKVESSLANGVPYASLTLKNDKCARKIRVSTVKSTHQNDDYIKAVPNALEIRELMLLNFQNLLDDVVHNE